MGEHTIPLSGQAAPILVGGKAANLMRLAARGFPVPDGLVVPPATADEQLESVAQEIALQFSDTPLAVRSSAIGEDGADRSYAGMFASVLDVPPQAADIAAAIRHVRASAAGEALQMAVLVMPMIDADAAGIAFTRHPVTGADVVVIEAVPGLADRLAAGEATGERWEIGEAGRIPTEPSVLTESQARQIADLAREVETSEACPQDIEWVLSRGGLTLVQARPITTIDQVEAIPIDDDIPPGFWEWDSTHSQRPNSPFVASFFPTSFRRASSHIAAEFGLPMDHLELRRINGYFHIQMVPPVGKPGAAPPPPALSRLLFKLVPVLRQRAAAARRTFRRRTDRDSARRWNDEIRPHFERRMASWRRLDLPSLADDELAAHIDRVVDEAQKCFLWNMTTDISYLIPLANLVEFGQAQLDLTMADVTQLLAGSAPSEYSTSIADLASMLTNADRQAIRAGRPGDIDHGTFWEAFRDHQAITGCRGLGYDVSDPCQAETGIDELAVIASYEVPDDPSRLARAHAEALRGRLPEHLQGRFDELLVEARATYPIREESEYVHSRIVGNLRFALLEAGRRMHEAGAISDREHVVYLEHAEVASWLADRTPAAAIVARRRGEERWALAHPPAPSIGDGANQIPDPAAFPAEVGRILEVMLLVQAHDMRPPETANGADGVGASPGRHTGPICRVESPLQFDRVRHGDVVVAPLTTSAWEVVFSTMGALVTEGGGLLSHPAIVAREYGLPAVTGCVGAMDRFADGQIVTVDGTAGTVVLHELAPKESAA